MAGTKAKKEISRVIGDLLRYTAGNCILKIANKDGNIGKIHEEPFSFLYTMITKLSSSLGTCATLISSSSTILYKDSLFVLFRTSILDSITTIYLLRKSNNDIDLLENIMSFNFDHIQYSLRNISKYGMAFYNRTSQHNQKMIDDLKNDYLEYYNVDGSEKYKPLKLTIGEAISYLINNPETSKIKPLFVAAFELYELYSKIEHFGAFSFALLKRNLDKERESDLLLEIIDSIQIIMCAMQHLIPLCCHYGEVELEIDDFTQIFDSCHRDLSSIRNKINTIQAEAH